jgi:ABC-2 type transport system ATP-binding protein
MSKNWDYIAHLFISKILKETVLSAQGLQKRYGKLLAVNNVSIQIEKGSVFGLLGPNGSGKSTTLGMVLGVLTPDAGAFQWFGEGNDATQRRKIGTLIEGPNFYPYLSAYNNLKVNATIKEVPFSDIERVLRKVDLWERKNSKFKTFSTGMKQRLGIANALLGNPELLILDEPTNGLDPQGIAEVRDLIIKEAENGQTILLASHLLDEVEKVCTHMAVLQKGNMLYQGEVARFLSGKKRIEVGAADQAALLAALQNHPQIEKIITGEKGLLLVVNPEFEPQDLNRFLFEKGITASHLSVEQHALETKFLELTATK